MLEDADGVLVVDGRFDIDDGINIDVIVSTIVCNCFVMLVVECG